MKPTLHFTSVFAGLFCFAVVGFGQPVASQPAVVDPARTNELRVSPQDFGLRFDYESRYWFDAPRTFGSAYT